LEGLVLDAPQPGEILVKLVAAGVAKADLDAIQGEIAMPLPFVPGTEGAGIVERMGDGVTGLEPGESVIISFDFCGRCTQCLNGRPRGCVDFAALNMSGRRHDGSMPFLGAGRDVHGCFFGQSAFATHLVGRASRAVKVATEAPLELLACLAGEVSCGAGTILHGFDMQRGDSLVVTGAGVVGLAAIMVAKLRGAGLIVVADPDEGRRARATEAGATVAVHATEELGDLVRRLAGDGASFALETIGDPACQAACVSSLVAGGTCALVGSSVKTRSDLDAQFAKDAPRFIPADGGAPPSVLVPELVALHAEGRLQLERLVDFFAFEHVNDALAALRQGSVVKPVLRFPLGGFGSLDRALVEGAADEAPVEPSTDDATARETVAAGPLVSS
jgi:aryl-alcohol dehydrogenase